MIQPLHNFVVLEKATPQKKTKSGIILSSDDQEAPKTAKVIAVGPGKGDSEMSVSVGDFVIYRTYATTDVDMDEKTYLIVEDKDILAKVEGETNE